METLNKEIEKVIETIKTPDSNLFTDYYFSDVNYLSPEVYEATFSFEVDGEHFMLQLENAGENLVLTDESGEELLEVEEPLRKKWYAEIKDLFITENEERIEEENREWNEYERHLDNMYGLDR